MNRFEKEMEIVCDELALPIDSLEDINKRFILFQARLAAQIAASGNSREFAVEFVQQWLKLLLPDISDRVIVRFIDNFSKTPDLDWLKGWDCKNKGVLEDIASEAILVSSLLSVEPHCRPNNIQDDYIKDIGRLLKVSTTKIEQLKEIFSKVHSANDENLVFSFLKGSPMLDRLKKMVIERLTSSSPKLENVAQKLNKLPEYKTRLSEARTLLFDAGFEVSSLNHLISKLDCERFRVTVLGEFKRGKSSTLNSLLNIQGLLPVDDLPCTSGITIIRYGSETKFFAIENGEYLEIQKEEFHSNSGNAHEDEYLEENSVEAMLVTNNPKFETKRWLIKTPSDFLKGYEIDLIDTPGIGESYVRNILAFNEAKLADAAIVILKASQLLSLTEIDLLKNLSDISSKTIVIVNFIDETEQTSDQLIDYCYKKLINSGLQLNKEQFFPLTGNIIDKQFKFKDEKLERFLNLLETLKTGIKSYLLNRYGSERALGIKKLLKTTFPALESEIKTQLENKKNDLCDIESARNDLLKAEVSLKKVEENILMAKDFIAEQFRDPAKKMKEHFDLSINCIFLAIEKEKDTWLPPDEFSVIKIDVLKRYIKAVCEIAQQSTLKALKNWIDKEIAPIFARSIDETLQKAFVKLEDFEGFLKNSLTTKDPVKFFDELREKIVKSLCHDFLINDYGVEDNLNPGLNVLFAAILGYVLSDILLYYILKLIAGFLHPLLLLSAIMSAIGIYLSHGEASLQQSIRNEVLKKIKEALTDPFNRHKIFVGFEKAAQQFFHQLSETFESEARSMLNEIEKTRRKCLSKLNDLIKSKGDPEKLQAEINRLETIVKNTSEVFISVQNDF